MFQNNVRDRANGRHVDRARIELREKVEAREERLIDDASADLRQAISRLLGGSDDAALRQEASRIEAQRDGLVALLRAVASVVARIDRCETMLSELHQLAKNATPTKEWYTVGELSQILGKAEFTVREWCRLGRVNAAKRDCGRGQSQEWIVSHAELIRIQNEGLLPD